MDSVAALAFARALIDIDSTTGREEAAGAWLASELRGMGYTVTEQRLARGASNVFASLGDPALVLSTHYDCVPPFFPSEVRDGRLYGRGSCDAKGIVAAQVAAAARLRAAGETRVGLLFLVGEERGSDGAALANRTPGGSRFLINGEPTDCRLARATKGILRVRLHATGVAAHSAYPERGVSAIEKLIDALVRFRTLPLPSDPELGPTTCSIGLIEGGVAPNVIPPHAWAELMFRTIGPAGDLLAMLATLEPLVATEEVLRVEPIRLHTVPGFDTAVFAFTTDVPFLDRWGTPMLFGPGSILVAHTDQEHLDLAEFDRAIDAYVRLAQGCLGD